MKFVLGIIVAALFGEVFVRDSLIVPRDQSGYLPRILGALLLIGGVGYIVFSLAQILAPAFAANYLFPWIVLPALPAELGLALWLPVKGVNVPKWKERARG
jgi:hypothetical protein